MNDEKYPVHEHFSHENAAAAMANSKGIHWLAWPHKPLSKPKGKAAHGKARGKPRRAHS